MFSVTGQTSPSLSRVSVAFREAFLSSGDVASYQGVSDNMVAALPLLSDSIQPDAFSLTLPVPPPLEARGRQVGSATSHHISLKLNSTCQVILFIWRCLPPQAQRMYPWRSFMACQGLFPLSVWDVPPIEDCMQVQHLIFYL